MRSLPHVRSLAGRVFLVEIVIVVLLVSAGALALARQAQATSLSQAKNVTKGVAESFAKAPGLVQALDSAHPSAVLQPETEAIRKATGVDSVIVFSAGLVQLTSPFPSYVDRPYTPPAYVQQTVIPELRAGQTVTFTLEQPDGYHSISTAVPVFSGDVPKGVVVANITTQNVDASVSAHLPVLLGGAGLAVLMAATGTALASRRLLRQTRGLGPSELARMYEHHEAVLHAVREGVLIIGNDGRLTLANDEARRLLGLPEDSENRPVTELELDPATAALLTSDEELTDQVYQAGDRLVAVNKRFTTAQRGRFTTDRRVAPSSVVTLRDSTELYELTGRVETASRQRQLLFSAGASIGRTLDIAQTCEELAAVAVPGFADLVCVSLLEAVTRGEEPSGSDRQLRRMTVHGVPGTHPLLHATETVEFEATSPQAKSVDSGHAVLDSCLPQSQERGQNDAQSPRYPAVQGINSMITVPLQVRGVVLGLVEFWRLEHNPSFAPDDLSLAEELAARAAVSVDNARRYSREHGMAMTLQRSLLPATVPHSTALEIAFRYLPARSAVGGDWFDVIPLPGFRTALVVGDVVGHGIHAAVAMGRLRTAVHNFSALDLPPDEVLGRLDELVTEFDAEANASEITGSTCLYAIYDPTSGVCTLARAGHPGPALLSPGGSVDYPEVAVSPPLGVGGHPFETTELHLAPGSHLVFFTDGLIESRGHDLDEGLQLLQTTLTGKQQHSPDGICQAVTQAMLRSPADDVALLVAKTGLLKPSQVAEWDVEMDPSVVADVRSACVDRLMEWGLDELAFSSELVLSELITNAIRYGAPPVHVRLLHDTSLVCEVSDASSTSPHLRWAATTDEGGRGIFLIAQLSQRWGTRYTPSGKVIWSQLVPAKF